MVYICQPQTGNPSNPADKPPPPKDYLALSLLSLVCCCAPLGLVALLKSLEVMGTKWAVECMLFMVFK